MIERNRKPRRATRSFSIEFKRQVVEQSLAGIQTIAAVAREHDIREGQLWRWRRDYEAGKFDVPSKKVNFLPVGIQAPTDQESDVTHKTESLVSTNCLELHLGPARLLIHGRPDRQTLVNVIEALR